MQIPLEHGQPPFTTKNKSPQFYRVNVGGTMPSDDLRLVCLCSSLVHLGHVQTCRHPWL